MSQTEVTCEVITMNQAKQAEIFEQILLSYVEMCYSMSLALTQNHDEARDLEWNLLMWVWRLLDSKAGRMEIKRKLLNVLPWLWETLDNEDGMIMVKKKILKVLYTRRQYENRINYEQSKERNSQYLSINYQTAIADTFNFDRSLNTIDL